MRTNAAELFKVLIAKDGGSHNVNAALADVLALPQNGKTAGLEHRLTLYAMLANILPSAEVSSTIVPAVPHLLVKETNDTAVGVLASVMAANLTYMLEANMQLPADLTTVVAREMSNPKPLIRRAFVYITGSALWNINKYTDAVLTFSTGIASALEATLKMVTTNPQTTGTSPWEGYVALALFMGPMGKIGTFGMFVFHGTAFGAHFFQVIL